MRIYDISQELFHSVVFKGDMPPTYLRALDMKKGNVCNLTTLQMCAHNGTHIDAPYHFVDDGKTIDQLDLNVVIGDATVVEFNGTLTAENIHDIMKKANKRILFKGATVVSLEAAKALNEYDVLLVGNESQTVGPEDAPKYVHLELLGNGVVLLEGIRLEQVPEGNYLLNAAPINLGGADGAPCRAVLLEL